LISYTLSLHLLERGDTVHGVDNLNDYFDSLKEARLNVLRRHRAFEFRRLDVADRSAMARLFAERHLDAVAHLAAQAGVRYSVENPQAYIDSNLVGFGDVLEGVRHSRTSTRRRSISSSASLPVSAGICTAAGSVSGASLSSPALGGNVVRPAAAQSHRSRRLVAGVRSGGLSVARAARCPPRAAQRASRADGTSVRRARRRDGAFRYPYFAVLKEPMKELIIFDARNVYRPAGGEGAWVRAFRHRGAEIRDD
jgi:hypothetical protein